MAMPWPHPEDAPHWQDLLEFMQRSSKRHMHCKGNVLQYYRQFLALSEPLILAHSLTAEERDAAFWSGFHPDDRNDLWLHLLAKTHCQPSDAPFHFQDVVTCALTVFAYTTAPGVETTTAINPCPPFKCPPGLHHQVAPSLLSRQFNDPGGTDLRLHPADLGPLVDTRHDVNVPKVRAASTPTLPFPPSILDNQFALPPMTPSPSPLTPPSACSPSPSGLPLIPSSLVPLPAHLLSVPSDSSLPITISLPPPLVPPARLPSAPSDLSPLPLPSSPVPSPAHMSSAPSESSPIVMPLPQPLVPPAHSPSAPSDSSPITTPLPPPLALSAHLLSAPSDLLPMPSHSPLVPLSARPPLPSNSLPTLSPSFPLLLQSVSSPHNLPLSPSVAPAAPCLPRSPSTLPISSVIPHPPQPRPPDTTSAGLVELQLLSPSPTLPSLVHPISIPLPPDLSFASPSQPPNSTLMPPRNTLLPPSTVSADLCSPCPFQSLSTSPIDSILPRSPPPQPPDTWQRIRDPLASFFETEVGEVSPESLTRLQSDALAHDAELNKILGLNTDTLNNAAPPKSKPQHQDEPQNHHQHRHHRRHVCRPPTPLRSHGHSHSCHWHLKQRKPQRRHLHIRSPSAPHMQQLLHNQKPTKWSLTEDGQNLTPEQV
ncbi:hypothetical protein BJY52DRAFT_1198427 [Lactarius psammicola]|nr:hypothetical protein BJY52DRAFT_1198427 [Lactarius psammicola]